MMIPTTRFDTFKELQCGTLFSFLDSTEGIWCKTPFADMMEHNNKYSNADGAFCTAICVTSEEQKYIQCNPDITVLVIDSKKVFGI